MFSLAAASSKQYIHSKGICYADLSLENVILDEAQENAFVLSSGISFQMPVDAKGQR